MHKPAAFPTARLLTAHQAFIAAQRPHTGVVKAVSTGLRYIRFQRAFLLGAQEVRVQILPPSLSRLLTLQWTVRGGSTAEVLSTLELPYSTEKNLLRESC